MGRLSIALFSCVLIACSTSLPPEPTPSGRPSSRPSPSAVLTDAPTPTATGTLVAEARGCPVTEPQPAPGPLGSDLFGGGSAYGNGDLWVGGLWPHGVITAGGAFIDRRGAVRMKFGWWRETPGTLTIGGKRLDAPGPPLSAIVPTGYGASGFQASSIRFPTEGCWEVTGRVGDGTLTFVTYVIKLD